MGPDRLSGLRLRPATGEDAGTLWRWANDPTVRATAFNEDPIPWEGHLEWLRLKLADPSTVIYVAELDGRPVAQVRFDVRYRRGEVDVSVAQERRGGGLGSAALALATGLLFESGVADVAVARIKASNAASQRAFRRAGYEEVDTADGVTVWEARADHLRPRG